MLHPLPIGWEQFPAPARFTFPFAYRPHPWARLAAEEVIERIHSYMEENPDSELNRCGKMFGVLVVRTGASDDAKISDSSTCDKEQRQQTRFYYLCAFSALLDGSFQHEGFVPPVYDWSTPDGFFRKEEAEIKKSLSSVPLIKCDSTPEDQQSELLRQKSERRSRSRALQRRLFEEYHLLNYLGDTATPLEIFQEEKELMSEEDYFERRKMIKSGVDVSNIPFVKQDDKGTLPPSGTGDCCAPKLLQYAYQHNLQPVCMAEFWIGAPPKNDIRQDSNFYPACTGRCKPLLKFMLAGLEVDENPLLQSSIALAEQTRIVYQDHWLAVVDKPSGLLTIPAKDGGYSLVKWAIKHLDGNPSPVHRLDQDTSGLVVICKRSEAMAALQAMFEQRKVKKHYEAVLARAPINKPKEGVIELPLLKNPLDSPRQMVSFEHGKPATTKYKIREIRADGTCLIDFYPITGRTHQLRIHAAHHLGLNAPIVGDRLYGEVGQQAQFNSHPPDDIQASNLMLHAAEISFTHPITGRQMYFHIPKF